MKKQIQTVTEVLNAVSGTGFPLNQDLKRNTERMLVVWCCIGMLIYPFIILFASVLGFDKAATLITDIASVYVIAASGVVAAFMGFNAYAGKADKNKASITYEKEQKDR